VSIINQIPHTTKPLKPSISAKAIFSNPEAGAYSFDTALNDEIIVFVPRAACPYLVERLAWSASIPGEYWSAMCRATRPAFTLYTKQGARRIPIEPQKYTLSSPTQGVDFVAWIMNVKVNEPIYASLRGVLDQIPETVGKSEIDISIDLDIYEMSDMTFQKSFVNQLSVSTGQQIRGGI
jgi:hypothetical protein